MRAGPYRRLSTEELMLLNCGAGEDSWESLGFARKLNQSILKEINPEYSLEGLMLKLQYFSHLIWRTDSLEKTLMLGKVEGKRRRGRQKIRWLDSIIDSMDMNLSKLEDIGGQGSLVCCSPWGCRVAHDLVSEQQQGEHVLLQELASVRARGMVWE